MDEDNEDEFGDAADYKLDDYIDVFDRELLKASISKCFKFRCYALVSVFDEQYDQALTLHSFWIKLNYTTQK